MIEEEQDEICMSESLTEVKLDSSFRGALYRIQYFLCIYDGYDVNGL